MKLRWHVLILVAVAIAPVLACSAALIRWHADTQRRHVQQGMQQTVKAMTFALDQELRVTAAALQVLAQGAAGAGLEARALRPYVLAAKENHPAWAAVGLVLGERVFPIEPPIAALSGDPSASAAEAMLTGRVVASELYESPAIGALATALHVPVERQGKRVGTLAAVIPSSHWTRFLQERLIPAGWVAGVIDRNGIVVGRSRAAENFVGKPAPRWVQEAIRASESGHAEGPAFEGQSLSLVFQRSAVSGWTVAFAAPTAVFEQPLRQALWVGVAAGVLSAVAAALLALLYARRIVRPIGALVRSSSALAKAERLPEMPRSPVAEINQLYSVMAEASVGMAEGAAARSRAEQAAQHAQRLAEAGARQEVLESTARELERANEMKSRFLATMSHELRTPLNAIIGFAEVLKDGLAGELTQEQRAFAGDIHASGRHLLELINDILDLSKVEAGMMTLEPSAVHLDNLLRNSAAMLGERALKARARIDTVVEAALPPLAADERKLKQVLYNLLANALKFSPAGSTVTLSARRVAREKVALPHDATSYLPAPPRRETPEFLEISVRDNGIGIAPADLRRLFQPFVQADSSLARRSEGTGLGLALVRSMAELHGGAVGVTSEPGKGSTFFVWLPLVPASAAPARPAPAPAAMEPAAAGQLALVIEDDDRAARLIEDHLRSEGFRTIRAATGEEGLVRAAKERPGVITLDIMLPHMDGWTLIERLKADPKLASIPVVLVSVTGDLERGTALGAARLLQKPFSREELRSALAGIVPRYDGHRRQVLVVDDNVAAVDLLESYLQGDYSVLRGYGGREAIEAAQRLRPDLIVLDLMMPEVSGFEVVHALKARSDTTAIPIIVVTAKDLSAEERAVLNGHVQRVVAKASFDGAAFLNEVRRATRRFGG